MASAYLDRLEYLIRLDPCASQSEAKTLLVRLSKEAANRRARGASASYDFFLRVNQGLAKIRGTAHSQLRASCLWDCGLFFHTCGHFDNTLESARHLHALAGASGDEEAERRSHVLAAIAYGEIGDIADSLLHHDKALALARKSRLEGALEAELSTCVNIGVCLMYAGLHREAISSFQRVVSLAGEKRNFRMYAASALSNMAQCLIRLEDVHSAFAYIQRALAQSEEPTDGRAAMLRGIREFNYVQVALELGRLDDAKEHCEACSRYALWGTNPRGRGLADIAKGIYEVARGNAQQGLALLEAVLARSTEAALREDALRALVKSYEQLGQPERALHCLSSLLMLIRERGKRGFDALININSIAHSPRAVEHASVHALEVHEAKLRAKVAQNDLVASQCETLERLAITANLREDTSGEHGYRVGKLAGLLALDSGWTCEASNTLDLAARLHDIGKIALPDKILLASEELKDAERLLMNNHTIFGAELLASSNIPQLRMAEEIARCHHEWWDGTGYPAKLRGKRIPIHARIVALADVFDALTHGRPHCEPWSIDRTLEEMRSRRGTQFDPELTDAFIHVVIELRSQHADLDEYLAQAARSTPFAQARNRIRLMLQEGADRSPENRPSAAETVS